MMTIFDPQVLAFAGVAALLTITPGADTMLVVRNALGFGKKAGILTTTGVCCGLFIHAILSALGLSLILVTSAEAFTVVKLAGAAYLFFLGGQSLYRALVHSSQAKSTQPPDAGAARKTNGRAFSEGFLNNLLNPKIAVFYLAFLPQFIKPGDPALAKSLLLTGIHFVMGILWLSFVSIFIGAVSGYLSRPAVRRSLDGVTGAILIAFGIRLALERR